MEYDCYVSTFLLSDHVGAVGLKNYSTSNRLNGLHRTWLFGIVAAVAVLIEAQCYGTNQGYCLGDSPLEWAARNGREEVVKLLLEQKEVNPDKPNDFG